MTRMTPRETRLLVLAAILYGAVAISTGIRRGGDLEAHFTAARLWIEGRQLYAHPPRVGVWWPPFAVLLLVPFALVAPLGDEGERHDEQHRKGRPPHAYPGGGRVQLPAFQPQSGGGEVRFQDAAPAGARGGG